MMIFDISKIIRDNYKLTDKDADKKHIVFWFFLMPILLSFVFVYSGFTLNSDQLTYITSFLAIMVGFLINATILLITTKNREPQSNEPFTEILSKRSHSNIFYTILIGLTVIIFIIIKSWIEILIPLEVLGVYYFIIYALFIHFIFMILMIIKALYALYK